MRRELVLTFQGLYYMATGLWPVVHMASFEAVTGPKSDDWLVRMVGLLAFVIGATVYSAARHERITRDVMILAVGSAVAFAAIDIWYSLTDRISLIYLGDAGVEIAILAALVLRHSDG